MSLDRTSAVNDDEVAGETDVERSKSTNDRGVVTSVKIDDDGINRYFVVSNTDQYCWTKVTKVFSDEEEFPVNKVEMTILYDKTIFSMPENITWQWPPVEDKHIVRVSTSSWGLVSLTC